MTEKRPDGDSNADDEFSETIDLENEPIMATAEFKALVEVDDEPSGDDGDAEDDCLTITDKLERLTVVDDEYPSGLDPYDKGDQG